MGLSTTVQKIMDRQSKCFAQAQNGGSFQVTWICPFEFEAQLKPQVELYLQFAVRSLPSCTTCLDIVAAAQENLSDTPECVRFYKQDVLRLEFGLCSDLLLAQSLQQHHELSVSLQSYNLSWFHVEVEREREREGGRERETLHPLALGIG